MRRYDTREGADAAARWRPVDPDPQIAALTYHSYVAHILQTIGRGRASRRDSTHTLHVLLFCAKPVAGLPVDTLARLSDLCALPAITERQRAALDAGRATHNAALHTSTVHKVAAALQGVTPAATIREIAQQAGVNRHTVAHIITEPAHRDGDTGSPLYIYRSPAPPEGCAPPQQPEQLVFFTLPQPHAPPKMSKSALRTAKKRANRPD